LFVCLFVCLFVVSEGEGRKKGKTEKKRKKEKKEEENRSCAGKSRYFVCSQGMLFLFFTPRSTALKQFHGTARAFVGLLGCPCSSACVRSQKCEQRKHDFLLQEVFPSTLKSPGGL
jgi:hypothetical protein